MRQKHSLVVSTLCAALFALCVSILNTVAAEPKIALGKAEESKAATIGLGSKVQLIPLGTYATNLFDESAAEIVAHDPGTQRLYVVNASANSVDVLDIRNPAEPTLLLSISLDPWGAESNSVAVGRVRGGSSGGDDDCDDEDSDDSDEDDDSDDDDGCSSETVVAVAVEAEVTQDDGSVVFFDTDGNFLSVVTAGPLPDMITFTPDNRWLLVANEGEPNDEYTVDPEGSINVIDVSAGVRGLQQSDVRTAGFARFNDGDIDPRIRVFGPGASVAQDLEPEYIAVSANSRKAWVTLQENNALAVVDIRNAKVTDLIALGTKDHRLETQGIDASDRDDAINIRSWPTLGLYQPDAIAAYERRGKTYLVTANEGDARDYDGFSEEARVKDLVLDPLVFPDLDVLQEDENLGRLKTTTADGDANDDDFFEEIYSYGARSFSIWTADGTLVYDSGNRFERDIAALIPGEFNSTNDENDSFDNRSDDKGPEPEGVTIGRAFGRYLAFIGLERVGGIMVYDVTNPRHPQFQSYFNNRDFTAEDPVNAGDLGPEGILFIEKKNSPIKAPLLAVGNEVSGTTTIYKVSRR